jgi:hypothetical protein
MLLPLHGLLRRLPNSHNAATQATMLQQQRPLRANTQQHTATHSNTLEASQKLCLLKPTPVAASRDGGLACCPVHLGLQLCSTRRTCYLVLLCYWKHQETACRPQPSGSFRQQLLGCHLCSTRHTCCPVLLRHFGHCEAAVQLPLHAPTPGALAQVWHEDALPLA